MQKYPDGLTVSDMREIEAALVAQKNQAIGSGNYSRVQYWHAILDKVRGHILTRETAGAF